LRVIVGCPLAVAASLWYPRFEELEMLLDDNLLDSTSVMVEWTGTSRLDVFAGLVGTILVDAVLCTAESFNSEELVADDWEEVRDMPRPAAT
jgi:hypothetical protein